MKQQQEELFEKLFEAIIKELPVINGYLLMSKRLADAIYTYLQSNYCKEEIDKKMREIAGAMEIIYLCDTHNHIDIKI